MTFNDPFFFGTPPSEQREEDELDRDIAGPPWGAIGVVAILVILLLVALVMLAWSVSASQAHDAAAMTDAKRGQWFDMLKVPGTTGGCCNMKDCHQTQARQLPDRTWEAVMSDDMGSRWVKIPPKKVVTSPLSIDGEAYLCHSAGSKGGPAYSPEGGQYMSQPSQGLIYCFVPPIPGY